MQKRRFRNRPNNRGGSRRTFMFCSYGSVFPFDPFRIIEDDRRVNEMNWFDKVRQIDFYKDEVRMANRPDVYILDDSGNEVKV